MVFIIMFLSVSVDPVVSDVGLEQALEAGGASFVSPRRRKVLRPLALSLL